MITFFDDEDLLPIEEQVDCLASRDDSSRSKRCEAVRKSLNNQFMAARVSTAQYIELSRRLNKFTSA